MLDHMEGFVVFARTALMAGLDNYIAFANRVGPQEGSLLGHLDFYYPIAFTA